MEQVVKINKPIPTKTTIVSANYRIKMGTISLVIGIVMAALSGFDFYNPDSSVVWSLLTLGATLIGIGLIKDFRPNHK